MQEVREILETLIQKSTTQTKNIEIVGAKACDIERLYGKYRYNILLRSHSANALIQAIMYVKECVKFSFEIDIDPLSTI